MIDYKDIITSERLKGAEEQKQAEKPKTPEHQTKPRKKPKQATTPKPKNDDAIFLITVLIALFCIITQTLLTIYLL